MTLQDPEMPAPDTSLLRPSPARSGFTLLELMAVVGIILIMAALVVGGYSGIQRALGTSTGADNFRRALATARQQACVDGVDTFVWCIDRDRYVICRKGGIVSGPLTGNRSLTTGYSSGKEISAWWVCDEYADLGQDAADAYIEPDTVASSDQSTYGGDVNDITIASDFMIAHRNTLVVDVTAHKACTYSYPAFRLSSKDYEGWIFGLKSDEREAGTFVNGHEYAWSLLPLQTLPGGFVFDGSYKSDGDLDENWMQKAYVHFHPDGRAETGLPQGFVITEVGVAKPYTQRVAVKDDGTVTVTKQ